MAARGCPASISFLASASATVTAADSRDATVEGDEGSVCADKTPIQISAAAAPARAASAARTLSMSAAFLQHVKRIHGQAVPAFLEAVGPADVHPLDRRRVAPSEMNAEGALRQIAAPPADFVPGRHARGAPPPPRAARL